MSELEKLPAASNIQRLKDEMLTMPQAELTTEHYWCNGMYLRLLPRPATCTIVGKRHKHPHFYVIIKGKVTIVGDGFRETWEAPKVFICPPGTQRAVYAHEDSICLTVHRTDKTNLDEIEAELVEADPESPYLPGNVLPPKVLK